MADQEYEIEAFDNKEAKQWAQERTPEGYFHKVSSQTWGESIKAEGWGDTVEQAIAQARHAIPPHMKIAYGYSANAWEEVFMVQARSERSAEVEAVRRLIANHVRLFERKGTENRFCWFDPTNNLGYGPLSTLAFQHSEDDAEYKKAKAGLEQRFVQQHTKILGTILDGPRSFWGPLGRSRYKVEVLHYAKSVIACQAKSKYSILVTDDSCRVGIHTWGSWQKDGSESAAGYKVDDMPVYVQGGHRKCGRCHTEEKCRHDFGEWEKEVAYNEVIGSFRTCKLCGATESWRYSNVGYY